MADERLVVVVLEVLGQDVLGKLFWVVNHYAVALAVPREDRLVLGCLRVRLTGFSRLAEWTVFRERVTVSLGVCRQASSLLRRFVACCSF